MTHNEATQLEAVDKYLLDELTPEVRNEFEDHFFDCLECSTDLRATTAFMDAARREFRKRPLAELVPAPAVSPRRVLSWKSVAPAFALAASLLVIAYQNVVVFPGLRGEVAQLQAPEIMPSISLVGTSRGGSAASVAVGHAGRVVLQVDIPTPDGTTSQARFTSYDCLLYSPSGALVWTEQISLQAAKDTVTISAPLGKQESGTYSLLVKGKSSPADAGVEVQRYPFVVSGQ